MPAQYKEVFDGRSKKKITGEFIQFILNKSTAVLSEEAEKKEKELERLAYLADTFLMMDGESYEIP